MIGLRSQLNTISKIRMSALNGTISSRHKYFNPSFIKRDLKTTVLSQIKDEAYVLELKNDLEIAADMDADIATSKYSEESWVRFKELIKPNYFYILLHKSSLPKTKKNNITAGHVNSFFSKKEIVDKSLISLRPGTPIDGAKLKFSFAHDPSEKKYENSIWKVRFIPSVEKELKTFFFEHNPEKKDEETRFLIGISLDLVIKNEEEYLENLNSVKEELSKNNYYLSDGKAEIPNEKGKLITTLVKSLNCVTAFYKGNGYEGTESNPSTQMGTWSFMLEILGIMRRDYLLWNTKIKDIDSGERVFDDELKKIKK